LIRSALNIFISTNARLKECSRDIFNKQFIMFTHYTTNHRAKMNKMEKITNGEK